MRCLLKGTYLCTDTSYAPDTTYMYRSALCTDFTYGFYRVLMTPLKSAANGWNATKTTSHPLGQYLISLKALFGMRRTRVITRDLPARADKISATMTDQHLVYRVD